MVTLFPVTLQLYPDEYFGLANHCQDYATKVLVGYQGFEKTVPLYNLLLAEFYPRAFSFAQMETWKKRKYNKRYAFRLSIVYVRVLHKSLQTYCTNNAQQRVLSQIDQLLK